MSSIPLITRVPTSYGELDTIQRSLQPFFKGYCGCPTQLSFDFSGIERISCTCVVIRLLPPSNKFRTNR